VSAWFCRSVECRSAVLVSLGLSDVRVCAVFPSMVEGRFIPFLASRIKGASRSPVPPDEDRQIFPWTIAPTEAETELVDPEELKKREEKGGEWWNGERPVRPNELLPRSVDRSVLLEELEEEELEELEEELEEPDPRKGEYGKHGSTQLEEEQEEEEGKLRLGLGRKRELGVKWLELEEEQEEEEGKLGLGLGRERELGVK
jgi:hypothetical protein